ncbi:hypothetical protein [Puniceicoccus vermicola]|uniref:Uncharacterized protein n=1 Tax=Puniceicoccus vermicola TaxID=388746 RepID=A0A7X1B0N4_9BACT|nr:hypothetical protein [Puniceicoccus vermicola]MBC2603419.1 hypothetical protein [Puniceicoccus vermicola]
MSFLKTLWIPFAALVVPTLSLSASENALARVSSKDGETLTISVGDYRTSFDRTASWTMRSVYYQDRCINDSSGGYYLGTVLKERHGKEGDPFLGSGHRPEEIQEFTVRVFQDDQLLEEPPLEPGLSLEEGNRVLVNKKSNFVSEYSGHLLSIDSTTIISAGGIEQRVTEVGGSGDLAKIVFVYPFMHMLPKSTDLYYAFYEDSFVESGGFVEDKSMTLKKNVTGLLAFDPTHSVGIYLYHQETYPDARLFIFNRKRDNKLYFRYPHPKTEDQSIRYSVYLKAFSASAIARKPEKGFEEMILPSGTEEITIYVEN